MTNVASDLNAVLNLQVREGETEQQFAQRMARKANDMTDDKWETLDVETQEWVNEAIEALRARKDVPLPAGINQFFPKAAPTEDEEEPEERPVKNGKAKPVKAAKEAKVKETKAKGVKAKPVKAAKKNGNAQPAPGRKGKFPEGAKIKLTVSENPFRAGTKAHNWFSKIENGMTIPEAVEAGAPRNHIRWAHSLGHIEIG